MKGQRLSIVFSELQHIRAHSLSRFLRISKEVSNANEFVTDSNALQAVQEAIAQEAGQKTQRVQKRKKRRSPSLVLPNTSLLKCLEVHETPCGDQLESLSKSFVYLICWVPENGH